MKRLISIAAEYGVKIKQASLPAGVRGFYRKSDSSIYLNSRLTPTEARCTLAHELGHAFFGHSCTTPNNEHQANDYAARVLILPREYAAAARFSTDVEHLADDLGVTIETIQHYQQFVLQRIGDRTYARESPLERTGPMRVA